MGWDVCTFERVMRKAEANDSKHLLLGGQELMYTILKQLCFRRLCHSSMTGERSVQCAFMIIGVILFNTIPQILLAMLEERLWSRNGLLEIYRMMV